MKHSIRSTFLKLGNSALEFGILSKNQKTYFTAYITPSMYVCMYVGTELASSETEPEIH
jgi:hypothetical protein